MQVTLVDEEKNPGGVCLYRGCIPSKALLHVAKVIDEAQHASDWGVTFGEPKIDVDKLRAFKQGVVDKLTSGVGRSAKMRKVKFIQGRATLTGPKSMTIAGAGGETELQFEHCILATGSHPTRIPSLSLDSPRMMDSTVGPRDCLTCRSRCWSSAAATSASSSAPSTPRSAARSRSSR